MNKAKVLVACYNRGKITPIVVHVLREYNAEASSAGPARCQYHAIPMKNLVLILAAKLLFLLASIAMQNIAVCGIRNWR